MCQDFISNSYIRPGRLLLRKIKHDGYKYTHFEIFIKHGQFERTVEDIMSFDWFVWKLLKRWIHTMFVSPRPVFADIKRALISSKAITRYTIAGPQ